jgi:hypothetical protein
MSDLTASEQIRLRNLRLLHARPYGKGGPTSDALVQFLNEAGVSVNKTEMSHIYWEKKPITDYLAQSIEKAFKLPSGWLSEDREFIFSASPGETAALRSLSALPTNLKTALLQLIEAASQSRTN